MFKKLNSNPNWPKHKTQNHNPDWPKHKTQNHISNPHTTKASNTKIKPIFSTPKHKTQNPNFLIFWEAKHRPRIQTLEPKPNHLQPQIQSYQTQMESTSNLTIKPPPLLAAATFFFLVFAWGMGLKG